MHRPAASAVAREQAMKRYDPEHDTRWFLGVSSYQWKYGIGPWTTIFTVDAIIHSCRTGSFELSSLVMPVAMDCFAFGLSWSVWLFSDW